MTFLKIKKGDYAHYQLQLNFDTPKEMPADNYGKHRYNYGVTNVLSNEQIILDASDTMHKQLQQYKKGDVIEVWYTPTDRGGLTFHHQKIQQQPTPPAPDEAKQPTKDERIEKMFNEKRDSIHAQTALRLAVDTLSEEDKKRPWNTDVKVLLQERKRFFLEEIEGSIKNEVPQPEDFGD